MTHSAIDKRRRAADAMRIVSYDLDLAIDAVRGAIRRNQQIERRAATYLRLLKLAHQYRIEAEDAGYDSPLWEIKEPKPFNTGLVGVTAEEAKARAWKVYA